MASNYHLGYKTNTVKTIGGSQVEITGRGDSNSIEIDDLYQGVIDCSTNPNYPAGTKNMFWRVSVAGKIGGASGIDVEINDKIVCIVDTAGGTEASVGTSFVIMQGNIDPATVAELRTGTATTVFVTPKTLADNGEIRSAATPLALAGGTTEQLKLTTSAAAYALNIVQSAATASALKIYTGNNSASASIIDIDSYQTSALTGSDALRGIDVLLDSNGTDENGTSYSCYWGTFVATTNGRADGVVYSATLRGTLDTADTTQGIGITFGDSVLDFTQNNTSSQVYGVRIAAQSDHIHTHGQWYGIHITKTSTYVPVMTTDASTGIFLQGTYSNVFDLRGVSLADETYTVTGSGTRNNAFINIGSWDSPVAISNILDHVAAIQVNINNTGATSTSNFAAARLRSDTGAATTANHYGLQTRNLISHNVASAYGINASMFITTVAIGTGSVAVISAYLEGTGNITPAGSNPVDVVNITNVHSGTGVTNCLNVCNNTASTITTLATLSNLQAGTLTDAMLFDLQLGTITSVLHVTNVAATTNLIKLSGTTNLDCLIDFNDLTAENAHIISTSGTIATTWVARIRVITPDGNPGWINVYSASNEA
jgi:hypothetical protein